MTPRCSQANDYLWLASGSCHSKANCTLPSGTHDFNCNGNDCYYPATATTDAITDDNIFREMNNHGISWKVHAQSYAKAGGTPTTPDNNHGTAYYRRRGGEELRLHRRSAVKPAGCRAGISPRAKVYARSSRLSPRGYCGQIHCCCCCS
jgi:hypothetical protein